MSNIDEFPKNPKDGDKFVSSDGTEYVYQEDKKDDGDATIYNAYKKLDRIYDSVYKNKDHTEIRIAMTAKIKINKHGDL